jgi:hypothetical protein
MREVSLAMTTQTPRLYTYIPQPRPWIRCVFTNMFLANFVLPFVFLHMLLAKLCSRHCVRQAGLANACPRSCLCDVFCRQGCVRKVVFAILCSRGVVRHILKQTTNKQQNTHLTPTQSNKTEKNKRRHKTTHKTTNKQNGNAVACMSKRAASN